MKEKRFLKTLIGIGCILLLLCVALIALYLDSQSPEPILGIFPPAETTEAQTGSQPETETQNVTTPDSTETTVSTQSTEPGTEPATQTTRPSGEEPTTKPTESSDEDPTTKPTDPSDEVPTTRPTEPSDEDPTTRPTETSDEDPTTASTEPSEEETRPTLPPDEEPTEETPTGPSLPYRLEDYDLVIEKLAPYQGMFVEDGSNAQDVNAAMLMVHNDSAESVEYTQLTVQCGDETLTFDISALPAGAHVVVQEKSGKEMPTGDIQSIDALVVQQAMMDLSEDKIRVTDNGNNTLTIQNLTNEMIPTVRVFYKYYMADEGIYVGGIAFTVRITRLGAGASVTVQPSHYTSQTSRVVMALTYDSEV